jgi:NADH dehydrogenase [ubiquinone] 1 alpha subcomplex assembly factor 7
MICSSRRLIPRALVGQMHRQHDFVLPTASSIPSRCSKQSRRSLATKKQKRAGIAQGKEPAPSTGKGSVVSPETALEHKIKSYQSNPTLILPKVDFGASWQQQNTIAHDSSNGGNNNLDKKLNVHDSYHPDLYDPAIHLPSAPTNWEGYEASTPLWEDIAALIGVTGQPLTTAEYMRMCLTHPVHGYYTKAFSSNQTDGDDFDHNDYDDSPSINEAGNIIGPQGDFVTAPEMSQVFGECLGIWFYDQHKKLQKAKADGKRLDWQWLECGPGKGTLVSDLLRFACYGKIRHEFGATCKHVHLVESSPILRQVQKETLQRDLRDVAELEFVEESGIPENRNPNAVQVHWHDSFASFRAWQKQSTSRLTTYAVGQEFLDALPTYQFEKTADGTWRERLIDVALREDMMEEEDRARFEESLKHLPNAKKPRLRIVLAPQVTVPLKTLLQVDGDGRMLNEPNFAQTGSVVEVSPEAILLVKDVATLVDEQGGAALFIDYGQEGSADTIRAFAKHEQVHFLSRPGQVDLTADVDFSALKHAVNALQTRHQTRAFGPVGQGHFLMSMGASDRVLQLIERDSTTDKEADDLYEALVRLADPNEMGERFKVLSIVPSRDGSMPPGFETQL